MDSRSASVRQRQRRRRTPAQAEHAHGRPSHRYIGPVVYGGLDGIVTTFAVVSGVAGARLGAHVVLVMGLANLLADGVSMAVGAYLSQHSEQEYYERERQRERWQIRHERRAEKRILATIYEHNGFTPVDARRLTRLETHNPQHWSRTMLIEELGLLADDRNPLAIALVTFAAFVVAGSVPLLVYLAGLVVPIAPDTALATSLGLSAAALFGLGAAKVLVTDRDMLRSGAQMLIVGGLAAGVAYVVGVLLRRLGVGGGG